MAKQNDLMLNMLANQNFSISDFKAVGLNANNTSLESEEDYKKHSAIKDNALFKKEDGTFDEVKFHTYYQNAQLALQYLGDDKYKEDLIKLTSFHRDNIFAPAEQRRLGPEFKFTKLPNPDRESSSMVRLGKWSESSFSLSEIAQTLKVLANPTEAYDKDGNLDESKAIWHDAPNDSWTTDFFDTRVLAQWDSDGEHIDPITKLKVHHSKGLLKTNSNGTYYYENLDGRDVYGKQVLNKFDNLTTDGSKWNKYDFFDSDDKNQKSIGGSIMKNLALVGSMYIPYVGPIIAGLSVASQTAGMLGTLGKMLTGSNSPVFSGMEGWALSVNRQTGKTDYAKLNNWCWENFIGMIGDSLALFKEQRVLFEKAPALFKGKYGIIDEALDTDALIAKEAGNILKSLSAQALEEGGLKQLMESGAIATMRATNNVNSYIKGYQKIGEILSKGYMTGVTVADTYGEAKQAGASDVEATMLTLGYGAAEAALMNTGLGEWLFPELRYNKMHLEAVLQALTKAKDVTKEAEELLIKQSLKLAKDETKKQYVKRLFNIGKKAATDLWTASKSTGAKTLSNAIANASGEGFEEVSEELLADLSKGCFNVINYLRGDETRLTAFDVDWSLDNPESNWKAMFDRYSMNFAGGFIGGGLAGLNLKQIKAIKNLGDMTYDLAVQETIYMLRNKKESDFNGFMKTLEKTLIGNPNLSATKFTTDKDGNVVWALADGSDNQDAAAKTMIKKQLKMVDEILTGNGINMSDDSFLAKLADLLGDAKYTLLMQNSAAAGRMLLRFNTLSAEIAKTALQLTQNDTSNSDSTEKTDTEKRKDVADKKEADSKPKSGETKSGEVDTDKLAEKELRDKLKKLQKEKDDLLSGKLTGQYIDAALFELTPMIHDSFLPVTFSRYAETVSRKKYKDLSEPELNELKKDYDEWRQSEKGDLVLVASQIFKDIVNGSAEVVRKHADEYLQAKKDPMLKALKDFYAIGLNDSIFNAIQQSGLPTEGPGAGEIYETIAQGFVNYLPQSVLKMVAGAVGDPNYDAFVQSIRDLASVNTEGLTDEEALAILKPYKDRVNQLFGEIAYNKLLNFIDPIIKLGYINSEAKHDILLALDLTKVYYTQLHSLLLDKINTIKGLLVSKMTGGKTEEQLILERDTLITLDDEITKRLSLLTTQENLLKNLSHTPIEKSLNEFSIAVTGHPTNVTELLAKVENDLDPILGNLSEYTMSGDVAGEIDDALKLIDYYRTALDSARTDNGDFDNLFGYAHTINELNKKLGTESYVELPEIDAETADVLKQDLKPLRDKLEFAKRIFNINQGAKILQLDKANTNKDFLLFKKALKLRVAIPDDWDGKDEFLQTLDSLETLNKYLSEGFPAPSQVKEDTRKVILQEMLKLEDAFNTLFAKNMTVDKVKNFLKSGSFDLYGITKDTLNENTEDLDDNGFIWWMATRAAVKASSFYKRYASIIDVDPETKKPIAPIAPLMLATYQNYASIVNGGVFDMFLKAYRQAIKEDWNADHTERDEATGESRPISKVDYRKKVLQRLAAFTGQGEGSIDLYSSDDKADYVLLWVKPPKYSHITFTEGIAGAGKTTGVFKSTIKLLEKYHPDSPILKDVWIIHGANKKSGKKLKTDLGLNNATVLSYTEFMKKVSPDWKPLLKDGLGKYIVANDVHKLNEDGEVVSAHTIAKDVKPTLIIIDELTNFSQFDLDDINSLGEQLGILAIAAGDCSLSGIKGSYNFNSEESAKLSSGEEDLLLFNVNFVRSFKLGVSMRPANNHKAANAVKLLLFMLDPHKYKLTGKNALSACVNEHGVFGDLVYTTEEDSTEGLLGYDVNPYIHKTIGDSIDLMIQTLKDGEHIAYITDDPNNLLFEFLHNKYGDKIKIYPNNVSIGDDSSSLGLEFLYSIIDIDSKFDQEQPNLNALNDLYTGITRSILGDIIIAHDQNTLLFGEYGDDRLIGDTDALDSYVDTELLPEIILDYSKRVKSNYEEFTKDVTDDIQYVPRKALQTEEPKKPTGTDSSSNDIHDGDAENDGTDEDTNEGTNKPAGENENPEPKKSPIELILEQIPEQFRDAADKAIKEALEHPKTSKDTKGLLDTDTDSILKYGDVVKWGDNAYGVIVGIGKNGNIFEILELDKPREDRRWGYEDWSIFGKQIQQVIGKDVDLSQFLDTKPEINNAEKEAKRKDALDILKTKWNIEPGTIFDVYSETGSLDKEGAEFIKITDGYKGSVGFLYKYGGSYANVSLDWALDKLLKGLYRVHKKPEIVIDDSSLRAIPNVLDSHREKASELVETSTVLFGGNNVIKYNGHILTVVKVGDLPVTFGYNVRTKKWCPVSGMSSNGVVGYTTKHPYLGSAAILAICEYLDNKYTPANAVEYNPTGGDLSNLKLQINKAFFEKLSIKDVEHFNKTKDPKILAALIKLQNISDYFGIIDLPNNGPVFTQHLIDGVNAINNAFDNYVLQTHPQIDPEEKRRLAYARKEQSLIEEGKQFMSDLNFNMGDFISINLGSHILEGHVIDIKGYPLSNNFSLVLDNGLQINSTVLKAALDGEEGYNISKTSLKDLKLIDDAWTELLSLGLKQGDSIEYLDNDGNPIGEAQIIDAELLDGKVHIIIKNDNVTLKPSVDLIGIWLNMNLPSIRKKLEASSSNSLENPSENPGDTEETNTPPETPTNPEDFNVVTPEELEESAVRDIIGNDPVAPVVTVVNQRAVVKALAYSNFTFETGVQPCALDEVPQQWHSDSANKLRIDSVNGLLNLDDQLHHKRRTLGEYLDMISDIRKVIFGNEQLGDIEKGLTYIFKKYFKELVENDTLNNPKVVFGYRICNPKLEELGDKFDAYLHQSSEDVMYADGSLKAKQNHQAYIGVRIGFDGLGDVLELPILNITNPFSLLQTKDESGTPLFKEIINDFPSVDTSLPGYEEGDSLLGLRAQKFVEMYAKSLDAEKKAAYKKYKTLFDLFKLFSITNNAWVSLNSTHDNSTHLKTKDGTEWTPAKDMKNLGPRVVGMSKNSTQETGGVYLDTEYQTEVQQVNLSDSKQRKGITLSHIMYSLGGTIADSSGNTISIKGKTDLLKKGHPFVLYTFARESALKKAFGTKNLDEAWVLQLADPTKPRLIGMAYVLPPLASLEEFILYNTLREEERHSNVRVGNDFDGYKICRELFTNDKFIQKLIKRNPTIGIKSIADTVKKVITNIEDAISGVPENEKIGVIMNELVKPVSIVGQTKRAKIYGIGNLLDGMLTKDFLQRVLAAIVNPIRTVGFTNPTHIQNPKVVKLIKQYAAKALSTLRFHPDAEYKSTGIDNTFGYGNFHNVGHDEDYSIQDVEGNQRNYTVIGSINQDVFEFDPEELLNYLLNKKTGLHYYAQGKQWHETRQTGDDYVNGEITAKKTQQAAPLSAPEQPRVKNSNVVEVSLTKSIMEEAGMDTTDVEYMTKDQLKAALKLAVAAINKASDSKFAIIANGIPVSFSNSSLELGTFSLFNNEEEYNLNQFTVTEEFSSDAENKIHIYARCGQYAYDITADAAGNAEIVPRQFSPKMKFAIDERFFDSEYSGNYYDTFGKVNPESLVDLENYIDFSFLLADSLLEFILNLTDNLYLFLDEYVLNNFKETVGSMLEGKVSKQDLVIALTLLDKFIRQLLCKGNSDMDPDARLCDAFKIYISSAF